MIETHARPKRQRHLCAAVVTIALVMLLCTAAGLSISLGARAVSLEEISAGLKGQIDGLGAAAVALRIPRTVLALLAGAALGLSGALMQGVTRNPLADPGILGTNAGASLAVVIGLSWLGLDSPTSSVIVAIVGAAIASVGVYAVANLGIGGATPLKLALAGAALSTAMASLTTAIILPRGDIGGLVQSWMLGGVGGASFETILIALPFWGIGGLLAIASARRLNMLALGEDTAQALGENVMIARVIAAAAAIILAGATTAVCGPIGFVGLVVPHLCRLLAGVDYRLILPLSAITGSALMILADVVGRLIARPAEVEASVVITFLGAPVFIWIVRHRKVGAL